MTATQSEYGWHASASIRISYPTLDPEDISERLNAIPSIAQRPGESKVPHGDCRSAGYWVVTHRVESPTRPDALIQWAEQFVLERELSFRRMLEDGYNVNVYIGVHTTLLALGFMLPGTPTLWNLQIPIGIEFFSGG